REAGAGGRGSEHEGGRYCDDRVSHGNLDPVEWAHVAPALSSTGRMCPGARPRQSPFAGRPPALAVATPPPPACLAPPRSGIVPALSRVAWYPPSRSHERSRHPAGYFEG